MSNKPIDKAKRKYYFTEDEWNKNKRQLPDVIAQLNIAGIHIDKPTVSCLNESLHDIKLLDIVQSSGLKTIHTPGLRSAIQLCNNMAYRPWAVIMRNRLVLEEYYGAPSNRTSPPVQFLALIGLAFILQFTPVGPALAGMGLILVAYWMIKHATHCH